nr:hypothetical protein [Gammaproteobacteria bacterium]
THYDKEIEFSAERLTNVDFLLGTIYGRALSYRGGIDSFLASPIFGNGLFRGEYMVTQHNFHVEWLQYGGMIGYILYAVVLISHAIRMRRSAQRDHWIAANLVTMILILANCVTNGLMHGVMPYVLFLLMGLNEARFRINNKATEISVDDSESRCIDEMAHIDSIRILNFARTKSGKISNEKQGDQ